MKKVCLLAIILFVAMLFSIPEKNDKIPDFYNGNSSFSMNGRLIKGVAGIIKTDHEIPKYYISIDARDKELDKTYRLSITYVKADTQKQLLSRINPDDDSNPQASLSIYDGPVHYSYYILDTLNVMLNYFQFSDLEEFRGVFELSFSIDSISNLDFLAPETIRITEAVFEAMLFQKEQ